LYYDGIITLHMLNYCADHES